MELLVGSKHGGIGTCRITVWEDGKEHSLEAWTGTKHAWNDEKDQSMEVSEKQQYGSRRPELGRIGGTTVWKDQQAW
jgi:hypothetical protein